MSFPKAGVSLDILVIGGGLAGLATAYTLQRAGHNVTVLEAGDEKSKWPGSVKCPPNMTRVLHEWGLADWLEEKGTFCQRFEWLAGESGDSFGFIIFHEKFLSELMVGYYILQYDELHDALEKLATSEGATIRRNAPITSVDVETGEVTLKSGETLAAQLIVGADGSASLIRSSSVEETTLHGSQNILIYSASVPKDRAEDDEELRALVTDKTQLHIWLGDGFMANLDSAGQYHHLTFTITAQEEDSAVLTEGWHHTTKKLEEYGVDTTDTIPVLKKLLARATETRIALHIVREPFAALVDPDEARCIIVGDAAHPMTPTGTYVTALAMEDAEVLGGLLSKIQRPSQLHQLLIGFEEIRLPRCSMLQQWDREKSILFTMRRGPDQQGRDEALKQQMASQDTEEMDEEAFMEAWGDEVSPYNFHATDSFEDWWSKWGALMAGQNVSSGSSRPQTIISISATHTTTESISVH